MLALSLDLEGLKITPEGPIQLQQGEGLALTCDARGSKPLELRWKKEKVTNNADGCSQTTAQCSPSKAAPGPGHSAGEALAVLQ